MACDASVTQWITDLEAGDEVAAQQLWERYFDRLVKLARRKLGDTPLRAFDEEDVVLSALDSFCRAHAGGRYPRLRDRNDLWRLLITITERKARDHVKHARRQKRGGGRVRGESAFLSPSDSAGRGIDAVAGVEPTPEFAAFMVEEFQALVNQLDEPSLRRVALLKLEGYTNVEIAAKLERTQRSVERKLQRIRGIWSTERPS